MYFIPDTIAVKAKKTMPKPNKTSNKGQFPSTNSVVVVTKPDQNSSLIVNIVLLFFW